MPEKDSRPTAPEEETSLRQLSDAFARAMGDRRPAVGQGEAAEQAELHGSRTEEPLQPGGADPTGDAFVAADASALVPHDAADDEPCEVSPASILEAMLFVGNQAGEPLTSRRASEVMRGVAPEEIAELVDQLNRQYEARGCPYHIASEGAGYRMTLRRRFWPVRNRFYGRIREARLSQAAIDVMAIVAYRQPITAERVNQHRGRPSNQLLTQLVRRRLLRVERSSDKPRVVRYSTTARFLEVFGLESLNDLPRSDDDVDGK